MGVNLGGLDVGMAENFLNHAQIFSVGEEKGSQGMTQFVRGDIGRLGGKLGLPDIFLDHFVNTFPAEAGPVAVKEKRVLVLSGNPVFGALCQVFPESLVGGVV